MTRKEQMKEAAIECKECCHEDDFILGAEWADQNSASETFAYSDQQHETLEQKLAIAVEALEYGSWPGYDRDFWMRIDKAKEALEKIKGVK